MQYEDSPKSGKTPKTKNLGFFREASPLEITVALVTIFSGLAQVINLGVHIAEYMKQSESQSVQVIQKTTQNEIRQNNQPAGNP
ncbi:hypothetical protein SAMD00079811_01040 [Scytonema sp. HK-05]|uniref:hypothetical protein n=1 Tax=Scytonema sp. HK-05 TaxID=1137095 RepID=UPI00093645AD|nr:hypothetical protein [Scytonema sp. HK-05]OKH57380.1 hypothetical protein NIES2130_19835 [Scytonema sp. HK-05]BAY42527.1 hypothetical protein SAMD00079811_01040 [Scytonema sp. HK-05]